MLEICYTRVALEAHVRIDLYTKTILTVIAVALLMLASNSLMRPGNVSAQGALTGTQFIALGQGFWAIDTRSGEVWSYPSDGSNPSRIGKISQLGKPIVK
jgi:hypothetical protein